VGLGGNLAEIGKNMFDFSAKASEADILNNCTGCPQSMQDNPNSLILALDIVGTATIAKDVLVLAGKGAAAGLKALIGDWAKGRVGSATKNIYADAMPMESVFPELKGVNPHYIEDAAAGVNTNCTSCVNAAQQRLTGQNPNAIASPSAGYAKQNALLPSAPFGFGNATTPASVITEMQQAGSGAARPLLIQQNGVYHTINVVNRNGQVYFVDTQLGQIVTLQPNVVVQLGRPI